MKIRGLRLAWNTYFYAIEQYPGWRILKVPTRGGLYRVKPGYCWCLVSASDFTGETVNTIKECVNELYNLLRREVRKIEGERKDA